MSKKILDNLTGQEIKELINTKKILLDELDSDSLRKLMDHEVDLICYGEGDVDLISECSHLLCQKEKPIISKEAFSGVIERTKAEQVTIVEKKPVNRKARIIFKRSILVAVIASALFFSSCCVLKLIPDICQYIASIARQPEGTKENIDEFTFYNNGEVKKYATIEELVAAENLDIMYPTKWPEGIKISQIYISTEINGNELIQIFTTDTDTNINIELSAEQSNGSNDNIFEYQNIEFHIDKGEFYCATCYYKQNKYTISANSREDLILIIENLKE